MFRSHFDKSQCKQKGFGHILLIIILLAGIGIAVYLTQFTQVFKPKAAESGQPAVGSLDLVDGSTVAGWAKDPDTNNPIYVHVYIDGKLIGDTLANGYREDVGNHAFAFAIPPLGKGSHTVYVFAIGVNPDGSLSNNNTQLSNSPKVYVEGYKKLPLHGSGLSEQGRIGQWTTYVFSQPAPASEYNFVGLSGSVAISGQSENSAIVLFSLLNFPDGNCPANGRNDNLGSILSIDHFKSSFILKLNQPGIAQTPTQFVLPVKVPLKGCIALALSGGEAGRGDVISMNSAVDFIYDTEPPPSPKPYLINLGDEFCIGRAPESGCYIGAPTVTPDDAFALIKRVKEPVRLWSLTGNMAVGGLLGWPDIGIPYPSGSWTAPSDHYIYPGCNNPPSSVGLGVPYSDSFGPSSLLSQVPGNARNLFSVILNGNGKVGDEKTVTKYFTQEPIIMQKDDCLIHLQKFNAYGGLSAESQVYALVQPITSTQPSPSPSPSQSPSPSPAPVKPGDTDGDNDIDIFDYNIVVTEFGKKNDPSTKADLDNDNDVDIFDYNIVVTNFGK